MKNYIFILLSIISLNSFATDFDVTIIDSAVDFSHDYLSKYKSQHGVFNVHENKPLDESKRRLYSFFGEYNHATHVAGIVASYLDNTKQNKAFLSNAFFIKVGSKIDANAFEKLTYFLRQTNPRVVNISIAERYKESVAHVLKSLITEPSDSPAFINAVHEKMLDGFNTKMNEQNALWRNLFNEFPQTLFVIAAGNDHRIMAGEIGNNVTLPTTWEMYKKKLLDGEIPGFKSFVAQINLPNTLTVGSFVGEVLQLSSFSNYGSNVVDILADGDKVNSTYPDGQWKVDSGTSMAAPQISGLAASILQSNLNLTTEELKYEIYRRSNTTHLFKNYSEMGRYYVRQ